MTPSRLASFHLRARLYTLVREFFAARGVLEVETPILSAAGNTEPNIEGFQTEFTGHVDAGARTRYLRTSPEYPLKRLLAEGLGDCYELGRVFRNGEVGRHHNPEFSMLEWYRVGMDHRQLAEETIELVQTAQHALSSFRRKPEPIFATPSATASPDNLAQRGSAVHITTYRQLFQDHLDIDPFRADINTLRQPLSEFDINPDNLTRDDWLDLLITHRIQPTFATEQITVILDWPASQCALARIRDDDPPVAERFELYLGRHELANGYHELNDAKEQRARFERDNEKRRHRGQPPMPLDENLLSNLDAMPACAGVALGVERLLMCLSGHDDIADILALPFAKS